MSAAAAKVCDHTYTSFLSETEHDEDDEVLCNDYKFILWLHSQHYGAYITFCRAVRSIEKPTIGPLATYHAACQAIYNTFIASGTLYLPDSIREALTLEAQNQQWPTHMYAAAYAQVMSTIRKKRAEFVSRPSH